jgi:tetratricopeptide (TPR) repeat protein
MICRLSMGALLAILATVNLACVAGPRFTKCPGDGGRAWMELDSEHYTLRTDLPPEEATQAMAYLEQTHAAMLASAWPSALRKEMVKVNVYVLADSSEFEGLFPRRLQAFFIRSDNEPTIVLHGRPGSWQRRFTGLSDATSSPLRHELAHHLSTYFLVRQPRWVSEGLAEFLETMQLSEDGRTATLGTPNLNAVSHMKTLLDAATRGALMEPWSIRDVLTWEQNSENDKDWQISARYSGSWLLVYWLYNTRPERFAKYQALLAQGSDPQASLRDTFPELFYKDFDSHLLEYLRSGSYQELTVKVPAVSMSFAERALEDSEVHAVRAKLAGLAAAMTEQQERAKTRVALAEAELAESVRLEPHGVLAFKEKLAAAPEAERPAIARATVEAHPDDSEAWLLLAATLRKDASLAKEREAAYQKALELAPRSARAANGLAWLYVTQRRYPEALPVAKRAVALAPWSPYILDTYAMAAAGTGACADARLAEQRAIDLLQEHPEPEFEKELRERLAAFGRQSCQPPAVEP